MILTLTTSQRQGRLRERGVAKETGGKPASRGTRTPSKAGHPGRVVLTRGVGVPLQGHIAGKSSSNQRHPAVAKPSLLLLGVPHVQLRGLVPADGGECVGDDRWAMGLPPMVVDSLRVVGVTLSQPETDPPLLVDSDAVPSQADSAQRLEMVAGRNPKIRKRLRAIQHEELAEGSTLKIQRQPAHRLSAKQHLGVASPLQRRARPRRLDCRTGTAGAKPDPLRHG